MRVERSKECDFCLFPLCLSVRNKNVFNCIDCNICISVCPENAIKKIQEYVYIDKNVCKKCYLCIEKCPTNAIVLDEEGFPFKCHKCFGNYSCFFSCSNLSLIPSKEDKEMSFSLLGWYTEGKTLFPFDAFHSKVISLVLEEYRKSKKEPGEKEFSEFFEEFLKKNKIFFRKEMKEKIKDYCVKELFGFGVFEYLLDLEFEEITASEKGVFLYKNGWKKVDLVVKDEYIRHQAFKQEVKKGFSLNEKNPKANFQYRKYRINITIPPLSNKTTITIRNLSNLDYKISSLSFPLTLFSFLLQKVKEEKSILFAGTTSSGKTTLLQFILFSLPKEERIVLLEDTSELILPGENAVIFTYSGEKELKMAIKETYRQRPDFVVFNELRKEYELKYFVESLVASQSKSCYGTIHSRGIKELERRFELSSLEKEDVSSLDFVVFLKRKKDEKLVEGIYENKNGKFQKIEIKKSRLKNELEFLEKNKEKRLSEINFREYYERT